MTTSSISKEKMNEITMGYNWNKDMSFEEFTLKNPEIDISKSYDVYNAIENNYCTHEYEKGGFNE